jgi:hypothetical protein
LRSLLSPDEYEKCQKKAPQDWIRGRLSSGRVWPRHYFIATRSAYRWANAGRPLVPVTLAVPGIETYWLMFLTM